MKLGGILGIAGAVVGIVAAVASGGTLAWLAAGMLTLNAATSVGLIGGSVGKFMQSGAGRALTLAAGAAAAYGAFTAASTVGDVGAATSAQTAAASSPQMAAVDTSAAGSAAAGGAQAASGMSASLGSQGFSLQDAIIPPNVAGSAAGAGTNSAAWSMADPGTIGASGANGASMAQNSAQELNAVQQASQVQGFNNASVAGASTTQGAPTTGVAQPGAAVQNVPQSAANANAGAGAANAPAGQADIKGDMLLDKEANTFTGLNQAGGATTASAAQLPGAQQGGFMNTLMNTKGGAGLLQGAAGAIGGIGQGISQKQAMEDQLKAMQWANMQWGNQGQVANVNNAAAMPINVPGGYLQRAQAIRNLVSTNPFVPPAPTPVPGAPPPARPV